MVPWKPLNHLNLWLAGPARRYAGRTCWAGRGGRLVQPLYGWGQHGLLLRRHAGVHDPPARRRQRAQEMTELGACAYGPDAPRRARSPSASGHGSRPTGEPSGLRIEAPPAGKPVSGEAMITAEKQHGTVLVIQDPA